MNTNEVELDDDPRVMEAAREYLADLEAGRVPSRLSYYKRFPELEEVLAECFDGIELAHSAGQALRPPPPPQSEQPVEPLGDFKIMREVGRGGMGVVYEAIQMSLGRRVALKVLPFASALDAKQLQRFKTEAHAAAQLHHTNIVPVYAVGCERGVHFYAMQLIEGRPMDEVIRDWRGTAGKKEGSASTIDYQAGRTMAAATPPASRASRTTGRAKESFRTTARIVAQIADALEYAHEAGVIHRDIKPANLLMDAKGAVWITDFGLAQVSSDLGVTQTGDVVGTLRYMSPEQAAGKRTLVDHRTDVYSLGATLYELLTLQPVFADSERPALLYAILEKDPEAPRHIDRSIPVELETIVLKALAKTPADRYATAGEMAADLRRFLDERPILARRPTIIDRLRKWTRRHPMTIAASAFFLFFCVVVMAVAMAVVNHAYNSERQRTMEADERFRLAQRSADDTIRIAEQELADQPHLQGLRRRLLELALAYYQEFIELRRNDPDAQAELEVTRDRVKRILDDLAVLQGAGQIYLLRDANILDDLKLDEYQRESIGELNKRLADQQQETFREFWKLNTEERKQRFLNLARSNEAEVASILSVEQYKRLRQIALQCVGLAAFREQEVINKLELSTEQRDKIRAIESEMIVIRFEGPRHAQPGGPKEFGGGGGGSFGGGPKDVVGPKDGGGPKEFAGGPKEGGGGFGGPRRQHEQVLKVAMEKAEAILRPDQLKKWKDLVGEPLKGPLPYMPRGGFNMPFQGSMRKPPPD